MDAKKKAPQCTMMCSQHGSTGTSTAFDTHLTMKSLCPCSSKTFEIYCVELCSYLSLDSHSKIYTQAAHTSIYVHLCTSTPYLYLSSLTRHIKTINYFYFTSSQCVFHHLTYIIIKINGTAKDWVAELVNAQCFWENFQSLSYQQGECTYSPLIEFTLPTPLLWLKYVRPETHIIDSSRLTVIRTGGHAFQLLVHFLGSQLSSFAKASFCFSFWLLAGRS
jgi:hypothetical protein